MTRVYLIAILLFMTIGIIFAMETPFNKQSASVSQAVTRWSASFFMDFSSI